MIYRTYERTAPHKFISDLERYHKSQGTRTANRKKTVPRRTKPQGFFLYISFSFLLFSFLFFSGLPSGIPTGYKLVYQV
nr:MAG TPA: hypothetical protein [Bacteriophage sp.]